MENTLWDHLLVFVVAVALPLNSWRGYPAFVERVREEGEPARVTAYRETVAIWVTLAAALVVIWVVFGRPWADLGVAWGEPQRVAIGALAGLALLWTTKVLITRLASLGPAAVAEHIGGAYTLLPSTRRELLWYRVMSINAGITEELVYRGFLLWYLQHYVGLAWAAVLAVAVFTFAHVYQGLANVPALAFASAAFVGLYLASGTLLVPIVVHALVDIVQAHGLMQAPKAA